MNGSETKRTECPAIIHATLLDHLLGAPGGIDVETLAASLDLSPAELRVELQRLCAAGCEIDDALAPQVQMARSGLSSWPDYLAWACPLPNRNRVVEVYQRTGSTQDAARRIAASRGRAADGALAIADEQTAGRGRLGRPWLAPAGACVLVSRVMVADDRAALTPDRLALAAAVAVAAAVEIATAPLPIRPGIKWPNDLVIDGRKLAGILVETCSLPAAREGTLRAAIIGVGINVALAAEQLADAPDELRQRVTSLAMLGRQVDRLRVLTEVVRQLDTWLGEPDPARLLEQWRQRSVTLSGPIVVTHNGQALRGQVVDLDATDGLILRTESGQVVVLPAATTAVVG